jgi:hypothetical protein
MNTTLAAPDTLAEWARQYRYFADHECPQDPLYVALCQAIAAAPELLALMQHAPSDQRRPNLLLAALHERVLGGAAHVLCAYYPSVGGTRLPDAELPAALLDFARQHQAILRSHLQTRSTQTNEIGRCAVLWPALQHIADRTGRAELALLDFGSSAGLNLGVDDYHYDYGEFQRGGPAAAGRAQVRCDWLGDAPAPQPQSGWRLAERLGIDPQPIDPHDATAVRWLRACLWPHDRERARRLDLALAQARRAGHRVQQAGDCIAAIEPWLDRLPPHVQPVLFNSWVLAYLDAEQRARHRASVDRLVRTRGLAWLSAEAPSLRPEGLALPATAPGASAQSGTLWSLCWRAPDGSVLQQALAWSHPHGRWLQWTAGSAPALPL